MSDPTIEDLRRCGIMQRIEALENKHEDRGLFIKASDWREARERLEWVLDCIKRDGVEEESWWKNSEEKLVCDSIESLLSRTPKVND